MIALLSAPTNLGLRPPVRGTVPGAAKAPEALREAGLYSRFAGAVDLGVVLPGRYLDDDATREPGRVRNQGTLIDHARRLATRLTAALDVGHAPLVVGGDCSLLLGTGLALRPRGRYGLVHVDGHTDFRHPGNSADCASVAGEDLAAAVGLHWPALSDIDGHAPYFAPTDAVHLGCRDDDEHLTEARTVLGGVFPARQILESGASEIAASAIEALAATEGYWLQIDVDVLDPEFMPAVDSPDPGGLDPEGFVELLHAFAPGAVGASITVFDPDLDPDGRHARLLVGLLADGLAELGQGVR
jgi:arginase